MRTRQKRTMCGKLFFLISLILVLGVVSDASADLRALYEFEGNYNNSVGGPAADPCGDAANKIGTYSLSVLAKEHGIPFYVAAPPSTFDLSMNSGAKIPIEQRAAEEVTTFANIQIAPDGINVYNPAFDVTDAENITAIITEKGVIEKPNAAKIAKHLA